MNRILHKELIPSTDVRLGRHIFHDSLSKNFTFDTTGLNLVSTKHQRNIPILDQGQVGRCTGNAGVGVLGTSPHNLLNNTILPLNEDGATTLYSEAETLDGDGPYPPNDHGSSGLSIAKVLLAKGLINSYQHNFTLQDTLLALTQYPLMLGTNWHADMFNPDASGQVHPIGAIEGGHEYECNEIDVENGLVWCDNSWGDSWGLQGRFYLTWEDLNTLLLESGDSTVLIPLGIVPPVPVVTPRTLYITTPYMTGDDVKQVQTAIGATVDGIFGPQTKALVETFQTAHILVADGIVGPLTWKIITT